MCFYFFSLVQSLPRISSPPNLLQQVGLNSKSVQAKKKSSNTITSGALSAKPATTSFVNVDSSHTNTLKSLNNILVINLTQQQNEQGTAGRGGRSNKTTRSARGRSRVAGPTMGFNLAPPPSFPVTAFSANHQNFGNISSPEAHNEAQRREILSAVDLLVNQTINSESDLVKNFPDDSSESHQLAIASQPEDQFQVVQNLNTHSSLPTPSASIQPALHMESITVPPQTSLTYNHSTFPPSPGTTCSPFSYTSNGLSVPTGLPLFFT